MTRVLLCLVLLSVCPVWAAPNLVGKWNVTGQAGILTIKADNTYEVDLSGTGQKDVWGKATINDNNITFNDVGGPHACKGAVGSYAYVMSGKTIKFSVKKDTCEARKSGLNNNTWTRKKACPGRMLFLLFGNKIVQKDAGATSRVCPFCGHPGPHTRVQADNYFTIYWIPLFKIGKAGDQVRCSHCRQTFSDRAVAPPPPAREPDWTWTCGRCQNVNPNTTRACLKCREPLP